ncbi:transmembrane signal receptor [Lithospermum erythrorhizon]|uniref:Transmembrane signal receptor n=1 Tax=Lithospermum erythrorhizon TaxID=34254 RepID=A0AAV3Q761_LITER
MFVSRDVTFHENEFPFAEVNASTSPSIEQPGPILIDNEDVGVEELYTGVVIQGGTDHLASPPSVEWYPHLLRRWVEECEPNNLLSYFMIMLHTVQKLSPSPSSPSPSSSPGTPYPLAHYVNCDKFSLRHRTFPVAILTGVEPRSYNEAVTDVLWQEVMACELEPLAQNQTWVLEPLPLGKKALGCIWVYKIKYRSDGSLEHHKARLFIFGNHQVEGVDYNETFAPVAKMVTIRAFLAVAATRNWELHQIDVHNAFLHGNLDKNKSI